MKSVVLFLTFLIGTAMSDTEHMDQPDQDDHGSHKPYHRDLSDHDHHVDDGEHHDPRYDHEAFLGKEEASNFDHLTPEESKQRLALLVDKVDEDGDGKITEDELKKWIHNIGVERMLNDTERHFNELEPENGKLVWSTFEERYYLKPEERKPEDQEHIKEKVEKDKKKWKLADQDGDGLLSQSEYLNFLHPEEAPHMRDFVIDDTLQDLDKDKDGFLSVDEYLRSLWTPNEETTKEPDNVSSERESFKQYDLDKDGKLNREEIGSWMVPQDYDHSEIEAKHLIQESDADKDGVLTKEEILNKHDIFAGSQATDYGNAIQHEEL